MRKRKIIIRYRPTEAILPSVQSVMNCGFGDQQDSTGTSGATAAKQIITKNK